MLQASVDEEDDSEIRFQCGEQVRYVTVAAGLYDADVLCFLPELLPVLPEFPPGNWNYGYIAQHPGDGKPFFKEIARRQLPGIEDVWHPTSVDHLEVVYGAKLRTGVYQVTTAMFSETVVAKFAVFDYEIGYLNNECAAYQWIEGQNIGPRFLGNLVEDGRVIGFFVEYIADARHAGIDDLPLCQEVLGRLHQLGILHGDTNKHNFLIKDGGAVLIDFDTARKCDDQDEFERELQDLAEQLNDTSGRGGMKEPVAVDTAACVSSAASC